jgi:hypothetical protein
MTRCAMRWGRALACVALVALVTGCERAGSAASSLTPTTGVLRPPPGELTGALVATDLAVGVRQRFLLALIAPDNSLVTDADVDLAFFKVTVQGQAQLRSRAAATYRESTGLTGRGIYVARADFDEPGEWGVAAQVRRPGQDPTELRLSFPVKTSSSTPSVGDTVPFSRTPTGVSAEEIERFSSARPVDPSLYRLSIDEALATGKPLAVLFATPGFCTSRTCGPSVDVLQELQSEFRDRANFIHVEIYKGARPPDPVPTVADWGLPSEPWLFIVGGDGRLVDKLEGSINLDEARPALERAVSVS